MDLFDEVVSIWFAWQAETPVRWWLTEEEWANLKARMRLCRVRKGGQAPRLMGLPVAIERFGQPSRLVLADGTVKFLGKYEQEGPPAQG